MRTFTQNVKYQIVIICNLNKLYAKTTKQVISISFIAKIIIITASLTLYPYYLKAKFQCFWNRLLYFTSSFNLIYMDRIQTSDYLYISDLNMRNNNSSFCKDGMINIKNVDINIPELNNIIFKQLQFENNNCGSGCLVISQQQEINSPATRLLQTLYSSRFNIPFTVLLESSYYLNNSALNAIIIVSNLSLSVIDVKFIKNNGFNLSGGILFMGNKNHNFQIMTSEISENIGNQGGALYLGDRTISSTELLEILLSSIINNSSPYNIIGYTKNYELRMNIRTFKCQRGESYNAILGTCKLCDASQSYYSVVIEATKCSVQDDITMKIVKQTLIELRQNYWRAYDDNNIVTYCYNFPVNCQEGWSAGDASCAYGHIGLRKNEHGKATYYWELIKICQKELIIISLTFYEDTIIIKRTIIFLIIFCLDVFSKKFKPYKRQDLNKLDSQCSNVCGFSIVLGMTIYFADYNGNIEILWPFYLFMGVFNFYFLLRLIALLILGFLDKFADQIDLIRDYLNNRYPHMILKYPYLRKYLENSKIKQKRVKQRFLQLKLYLMKKVTENNKNQMLVADFNQEIVKKESNQCSKNEEQKRNDQNKEINF